MRQVNKRIGAYFVGSSKLEDPTHIVVGYVPTDKKMLLEAEPDASF